MVAVVELAGHVDVVAGESRGANGLADAALVAVHLGGVDVSVAGLERGIDRSHGHLGRDLKDAKAQLRIGLPSLRVIDGTTLVLVEMLICCSLSN